MIWKVWLKQNWELICEKRNWSMNNGIMIGFLLKKYWSSPCTQEGASIELDMLSIERRWHRLRWLSVEHQTSTAWPVWRATRWCWRKRRPEFSSIAVVACTRCTQWTLALFDGAGSFRGACKVMNQNKKRCSSCAALSSRSSGHYGVACDVPMATKMKTKSSGRRKKNPVRRRQCTVMRRASHGDAGAAPGRVAAATAHAPLLGRR